jgi:hypothetical protein
LHAECPARLASHASFFFVKDFKQVFGKIVSDLFTKNRLVEIKKKSNFDKILTTIKSENQRLARETYRFLFNKFRYLNFELKLGRLTVFSP